MTNDSVSNKIIGAFTTTEKKSHSQNLKEPAMETGLQEDLKKIETYENHKNYSKQTKQNNKTNRHRSEDIHSKSHWMA